MFIRTINCCLARNKPNPNDTLMPKAESGPGQKKTAVLGLVEMNNNFSTSYKYV